MQKQSMLSEDREILREKTHEDDRKRQNMIVELYYILKKNISIYKIRREPWRKLIRKKKNEIDSKI